ncbi:hypothetical protein AB5I41_18540 [Sphingomonas sp. MMS24-JH45]
MPAAKAKAAGAAVPARADANGDGKVSKAESQKMMASTFSRYDLNGDGRVDGEEAAKARADAREGGCGDGREDRKGAVSDRRPSEGDDWPLGHPRKTCNPSLRWDDEITSPATAAPPRPYSRASAAARCGPWRIAAGSSPASRR